MTVQAWLIFTPEEVVDVLDKSQDTDFKIEPRIIDNPLAGQLGDPLVIVGNSVAPARILNDLEYIPVWYDYLSSYPIRTQDSDILFLPPTA